MPQWPAWIRDALWQGSGVFEVAIGLLVVNSKFRRAALLAQLGMLIALAPFVVYILAQADDRGVKNILPGLPEALARCVLVFHNVLLFVWTARVYRDERHRLGLSTRSKLGGVASRSSRSWQRPVTIVALVMLAANLAGCAVIAFGPWRSGALYLWGLSSLAIGALVGFLFGVPRWVAGQQSGDGRTRYEPNTNIEKLSDWLTQILIGVGLVELHQIGPTLTRACRVLAGGLTLRSGRTEADVAAGEPLAFATGLVSYFLVASLIQGFLLTRMFLTRAWQSDGESAPPVRPNNEAALPSA
jgi:uncharacterized membrane protein